MSILDINNRTENWKTAYEFAPFFRDGTACAKLARTLDEGDSPTGNEVKIELFWKGMRDYKHQTGITDEELCEKCVRAYGKEPFHNLRERIEKFNSENPSRVHMKAENYDVSEVGHEGGLLNNLLNTEIDIVLETPNNLFIGEAKGEMRLGTDGKNVLVHQLIRQYVATRILIDVMEMEKGIVPFLVVADADSTKNTGQVQFMTGQGWLKKENVLTWGDIRGLQP